jgi:hypothetical protein
MNITKKEFESYEFIRRLGVTNMFDVNMVVKCSGMLVASLTKEKVWEIMDNYDVLQKKYIKE